MSRKTRKKRETGAPPASPRRPLFGKVSGALAVSLLVLLGGAYAATRYEPVRRAVGLAPLPAPAAQGAAALAPAKEYIYAGGRLVATEEPTPQPTPTPPAVGSPPSNLAATLASVSGASATVSVSWQPPAAGGEVASYVVERRGAGGSYQQVGQPVLAPATGLDDAEAAEGAAYLYRVKAVFAAGGSSGYSDADLATAVAFTDGELHGVVIKAVHLVELRRAVTAVRALTGLGAPSWTHPDPVSSPPEQRRKIYLEDVADLRARLDEALALLGTQTPYPTTPTLARGAVVNAAHFEQLRERVR